MWKSFNFILIHYIYIVFMTFLCSLIIGPRGDIPYIDALFFSAGAATQSGLNTSVQPMSVSQRERSVTNRLAESTSTPCTSTNR